MRTTGRRVHVVVVHRADPRRRTHALLGSVGDAFANAMMESFWSSMQIELLNRKRWKTRVELSNAMFDYIEFF